ncbi:MAG: site-specific integrase [Myxococcales bacterium]|nr:MAG: site-specific integrase [Myxococcales bacterium]
MTLLLPKSKQRRLEQMNKQLYPLRMRYRPYVGTFQVHSRRNGREYWKSLGKDIEVAYSRALILRKELDDVPLVAQRKATLEEFHQEWRTRIEDKLALSTKEGYHYYWKAVPEDLKARELAAITEDHVKAALKEIKKPSMRDHVAGFLSTIFNAAVKAQLISKNPHPRAYRNRRREVPNITTEQLLAIFNNISDSARPAVVLAGMIGLRRGEIMRLRVEDFDFSKGQVWIRGSRTVIHGKRAADILKKTKTGKPRVLPLPALAIKYLQPAINGKHPQEFLYPTFRNDLPDRLRVACRKAKAPYLNPHSLRHVCLSLLMETAGPAVAKEYAGHKDLSTTVDVYGHLSPVYLSRVMTQAYLDPELRALLGMAEDLQHHEDPLVKAFAEKASSICVKLCQGQEKGLAGNRASP